MRQPKLLIIGLDCAAPQLAFDRFADSMPYLTGLRRQGAFGLLESVIPPITVPAWACMMTGVNPGTLGIYGFRNRTDYSYEGLSIVSSRDLVQPTIWDYLSAAGKRCVVIGVPPLYPPKPLNGYAVSCLLTSGTETTFTYPPELKAEIQQLVGDYLFDVRGFRTEDKKCLLEQIYQLSAQRFQLAAHLLQTKPWDLFAFVDMGPDRLHHGFWKYGDPQHIGYEPGNPFESAMRDYYHFLDEQIGQLMELVSDDTQVLIVSDHGAKRMDGGIGLNEWLIREGYLTLKRRPDGPTRWEELEVDWERTTVWGEGGYYGRLFLNVAGREPRGTVAPREYDALRDELIGKLEALGDESGRSIGTRVHKPEEIYLQVRRVAPDLIALFGDLHWRSVGSVGWNTTWVHENDTGPDDANHAQHGLFVAANVKGLQGELQDLKLTQIAGTALQLMDMPLPADLESPPIGA
jgi:predicted AlkP superfamily phosphohydrolase/phosphomutase